MASTSLSCKVQGI